MKQKHVFVAMRHEGSIAAAWGYLSGMGLPASGFHFAVMDRAADPESFAQKQAQLWEDLDQGRFDAVVLASKINDGDEGLVAFLEGLKAHGLKQTPVVITQLEKFSADVRQEIDSLGMNVHVVEGDNLGMPKPSDAPNVMRTGLSQLGPVILKVLK